MNTPPHKTCILVLFIGLFCILESFAQLSDLHYLPPLKQGFRGRAVRQHRIYLSTPETTSFTVNAYVGTSTTPIPFTISNTSPAIYNPGNVDNGITMVDNEDVGVVINSAGLRFESLGGEKFYVNYRGSNGSQATSLTAKGRQGLGTSFKWGGSPNYGISTKETTSLGIMASENNTTVEIFGYDPNCEFRQGNDSDGITANTIQVVLNAGESYVVEALVVESNANIDGWLGASIVSNKPIAVSNGGLNYSVNGSGGFKDSGIDQPLPEDKLGKDYVFVRGAGTNDSEFAIIIATENNTEIYVNGSTTPVTTINNGDYYIVEGSNYSSISAGGNMYVHTSKNAYAYQNLAGSSSTTAVGLNFIVPLNCLIADTINFIPDITDAADGITLLSTGVTIIASSSTPDENIVVTDGSGVVTKPSPLSVAGTVEWKSFYLPNLAGNVQVQSTGPISVGFFGENGNVGLAAYFSGLDVIPTINLSNTGTNCLTGAILEIAGSQFDSYQWFLDGNVIAGANSRTYVPTVVGDYFVRATKGTCTYDSNEVIAYSCDPDINLNKSVNQNNVSDGTNVTFTITVRNFWDEPVTNLTITDMLPVGLDFIAATVSSGSFIYPNWDLGTLNSGQQETMTLTSKALISNIYMGSQTYTNTVTNTQDQTDANGTTDNPSVNVTVNKIAPKTVITNRRITIRVKKNR